MLSARLLFFFFLVSPALALELTPGFHPAGAESIPGPVRSQREKIFRVHMPLFATVRADSYEDILALPQVPPQGKDDLRECQRREAASCVFRFNEWTATTFVDLDPQYIWTNCHVVREWISFETQRQGFLDADRGITYETEALRAKAILRRLVSQPIPLDLLDAEGETVFAGWSGGDAAFLDAVAIANLGDPNGLNCSLQDDVARLRLSRTVTDEGISWKKWKKRLDGGERLYIGGFPRPTESREAAGNSDGKSFYWTFGPRLVPGPERDEYFRDTHADLALAGTYTIALLADGAEGMSGAPILNAEGEAVGIFRGLLPHSGSDIPLAAVGIDVEGMRYVKFFGDNLRR